MFLLPSVYHFEVQIRPTTSDILKFARLPQSFSAISSFHPTFGQVSLLPSNPITILYRLTTIKITLWRKWSITIPRTSWQSLVRIAFQSTWFSLLHLLRIRRLDKTYSTPSLEDKYWREAAAGQRDLQRSDARFVGPGVRNPKNPAPYVPPLVMYFTPALLPEYRDSQRRKEKNKEVQSEKPRKKMGEKPRTEKPQRKSVGNKKPNTNSQKQTESEKKDFKDCHVTPRPIFVVRLNSPAELRVIHQISQWLTNREVFDDPKRKPLPKASEYQKPWYDWRAAEARQGASNASN